MKQKSWRRLRETDLLNRKISELRLEVTGSPVEPQIHQLYQELGKKKLIFHPPCFVADEWFVPEGIPAIGIPFYLLDVRLRRLERKMILEVEGGTPDWFMRLIRHEAGHAYSYAYRLYRKKKWQHLFGVASQEQPDTYRPRPYSRSFVSHLENWYAQSHPDEDFAETFAVWLTPGLNWKKKYRGWKALKKLEYVDQLMRSIADQPPLHQPRYRASEFSGLNVKLKSYFVRKRKLYAESYPEFYDEDMRRLFTERGAGASREKASHYLKLHQKRILKSISFWSKEKQYTVHRLFQEILERCDELKLYVRRGEPGLDFEIAAFFTSLVMNYLFTGKFKRIK